MFVFKVHKWLLVGEQEVDHSCCRKVWIRLLVAMDNNPWQVGSEGFVSEETLYLTSATGLQCDIS